MTCDNCILDLTDACPKGAGRAIDDEICKDFIGEGEHIMNRNVWTSRKFWICVASALASLGTGISGIIVGNQTLAIIGSVCTVLSAAIYAFCEAWVDGKAVEKRVDLDIDKSEEE